MKMGCSSKKILLVLLFLYWSPVSAVTTSKHIDWYTERCHDGNQTLCDEAYKFAVVDAPDLVDGLMPCCSMMQIDCKTGLLMYDVDYYNFSAYKPFLSAGKEVRMTLSGSEGMAPCCASKQSCPMYDQKEALAQQLLTIAMKWNFTGYTGDWEWPGSKKPFYWIGWNATMNHIAGVLRPHGIGLGNGVVSQCESYDLCTTGKEHVRDGGSADPCCCPAYRDQPWADVLSDMGMYSIFTMKPAYHKCKLPNPNTDPEIVQYCGWEGGMMNVLHSPLATVYANRAPQLAPAVWIGDCFKNGTTSQGWTHPKLMSFLSFLDQINVNRIGLWCMTNDSDPIGFPCPLDNCPWMLEDLRTWKGRD